MQISFICIKDCVQLCVFFFEIYEFDRNYIWIYLDRDFKGIKMKIILNLVAFLLCNDEEFPICKIIFKNCCLTYVLC